MAGLMEYIEIQSDSYKLQCRLYNKNTNKLVVLLNGLRSKNSTATVFYNRVSWVEQIPYTCLYISDPTLLYYPQLRGGYYQGTQEDFAIEYIAKFIKKIAQDLSIFEEDIILYGSSQGGFASLMLHTYLERPMVLAECPQTNLSILTSPLSKQDRLAMLQSVYEVSSFNELSNSNFEKISVIDRYKTHSIVPRNIKIIVKETDHVHRKDHINPLIFLYPEIEVEVVFGEFGMGGHTALEKELIIKKMTQLINS